MAGWVPAGHHWLQDAESRAPGRRGSLLRPQGAELQAPPGEIWGILGCQAQGSDQCPSTSFSHSKAKGWHAEVV